VIAFADGKCAVYSADLLYSFLSRAKQVRGFDGPDEE
jgi:hypothetical protein